jgi:hypothetical protein
MVGARLENMEKGWPHPNAQICAVSQERAAERLNIACRTVQQAKVVQASQNRSIDRVSIIKAAFARAMIATWRSARTSTCRR